MKGQMLELDDEWYVGCRIESPEWGGLKFYIDTDGRRFYTVEEMGGTPCCIGPYYSIEEFKEAHYAYKICGDEQ
jgi:hypothetical protein